MLRSRGWTLTWTTLRALAVVAIAAAVIAQAIRTIGGAIDNGRDVTTTTVNFFSFFTVLSNISAVVILTGAVVFALAAGARSPVDSTPLAVALVCTSTYMIVTGIVYNTLLRNIPLPQGVTVPWSNEILHVWGPIFLLLDVLVGPLRRALRWRTIGAVVVFPIVWVIYTLIRGPLTKNPMSGEVPWYPYPFLDPALAATGYLSVALYVVGIAAAICLIATFVVWVGRRRGSLQTPRPDPVPAALGGSRDRA